MKTREPFDLAHTPLTEVTTLIEASAGTGKTFTLAALFLRLLLERNWSVRDILVVTFTEAATEELHGRIRDRLADAAATLRSGGCTDDPVLRDILRPHLDRPNEMLARLDQALCGFDETPIFTIHGFCQRTLRDRAFESSALFDTELLKDDSGLLQEIADDFWREHFYEAAALPVQFLLKNRYQPEKFLPLLRVRIRQPTMKVISAVDGRKPSAILEELTGAFEHARDLWTRSRDAIHAIFEQAAGWAKGEHAKPAIIAGQWAALENCFDGEKRIAESLEALSFFATSTLTERTKAAAGTPAHLFFDACERVCACERDYLSALQIEFLDFALRELPRRKQRLKIQTFEDLLIRLRDALHGSGGKALATELRTRYRAALIDEFQDTDPVQYKIFREVFQDPETSLFFIGDPKQAIYGFRGADIFTYLDAVRTLDRSHTLGRNFRSESPLVCALNSVFGGVEKPFLFDDIVFQPVDASDHADQEPLVENGRRLPPFRFWFMPREADATEITKEKAEGILPAAVAAEISRLLNGDTRLGESRLSPRDIAVLVPENRHAGLMQEALRSLDIPSVLHTEDSVFASHEARELQRVLSAVARRADERLIRAALATDLLGVNAPELDALAQNEAGWQQWMEIFRAHHDAWNDRGFMPMLRELLQAGGVRRRLLRFADGERRLTNLLHLGEVIHQAVVERRLGPAGTVRWLSEQITSEDRAAEEHQLRLERDDQAVKLVTIHKSKGLEYPVVFCPFSWKSSDPRRSERELVFFHERERSMPGGSDGLTRFVCDLGSPELEAHRKIAFEERLAENLRLLYVALTRARNRCYFVWGAFKGAGTSAAARLLHPTGQRSGALRSTMITHFKSLSDDGILRDLQRLARRATTNTGQPAVLIQNLSQDRGEPYSPSHETAEPLRTRTFTGHIARDWRILSFSALAAGRRDESPDYDQSEERLEPTTDSAPAPEGIFAFPRGTRAGSCLHKILEAYDFTKRDANALRAVVTLTLHHYGLPVVEHAEAVRGAIEGTLAVPLVSGHPRSALHAVAKSDRLTEIEFCFPIRRLSPALLEQGFGGTPAGFFDQLRRLEFQPAAGFVKGYIDLVFRFEDRFYIVDWKSNWLGNRVEDYAPVALAREMTAKLYPLQYHLYAVALHRYLALRLPGYDYDRHFGGVRYIFLRGVDPDRPELGVFCDRPARASIERLSATLLPSVQEAVP